jgi:hypothetical protein
MRLLLSLAFAVALAVQAAGAATKDPLRFLPADTDVVIKVEKPRALVETVLKHDLAKEAQQLQFVRDFLDGADARKFFQLVTYFERELGAAWPGLIGKLAGGGVAVGFKFAEGDRPVLLVIQGTDEAAVAKFMDLALTVLEDELTRQGAKEMPVRQKYQGVDCVFVSKALAVARVGDALLVSNADTGLRAGVDQHVANTRDPKAKNMAGAIGPKDAAKILPPDAAAWAWVNLKPVKELPKAKDLFTTPRNDVVQTVLFADILDVARRSDFVAAGLYQEGPDLRLTVRMPAGRDGSAPDVELHLPKDPKVPHSLPLLEPKGVLLSYSFYLDLDPLYKNRDAILPPKVAKDFVEGEKQISRFLLGTSLPQLFAQGGPYFRIVAVQPEKVADYKTEPEQKLPAFALVLSMRDPAFAKSMTSILKGASFAVSTQASLRSWEEDIAGVRAFGYSFPETGKFPDDPQKVRFNYQPTFAVVKDQYVFASNKGLCRELIGILEKEDRYKPVTQNLQLRGYASGLGDFLNLNPDQALASTIVAQGVKVGEAKKQTEALFGFLQKLGTVGLETDYTANQFRFDLLWRTRK